MGALRSWPAAAAVLTLVTHLAVALVFDLPGTFRKYTLAAEQHLAGQLPSERLMDLSPLYFELTVLAARLVPRPDTALVFLQIVWTAIAAGFLAWLLERRFGRRWAMIAVAIFLLDRHVLVYERILEPETLLVFLVLGWIVFLERRAPLLAGVFAGASLLTRPTFLPIALLIPLYFRARGDGRWKRFSLVFAIPVLAALSLLMWRAAAVSGDLTTPVMNPGTVFYEGNHPLSRGTSAVYPPVVRAMMRTDDERPDIAHEHYRTVARAAKGENLSIAEVNRYWSGLAMDFIRAEPGRFIQLLRDKMLRIFGAYRWHDVEIAWRYEQSLPIPHVPFAFLGAFALLGLIYEARRANEAMPFYVLTALQVSVMLAFYVSARQRLVLLPAAIYFALGALEHLRSERRRSLPLVLIALLAITFLLPDDAARDDRYVKSGNTLAQQRFAELREAARTAPLAAHVELALDGLRHAPWVEWVPAYFPQERSTLDAQLADTLARKSREGVSAAFDRAVVFLRAGRLDEAEALLEALDRERWNVYRGAKQPSDPRFYLSRIAALRGDSEGAAAHLEAALETSPGDPFLLAELLALTDGPGFKEALLTATSALDARYLLGRALLFHGRAEDAVEEFRFVVERLAHFRTAKIYLAVALDEAGRTDEGAARYLEAVREEPDPLLLSARSSELFRRWAALHRDDAGIQLIAAHVLHEHGRLSEALEILEAVPPEANLSLRIEREKHQVLRALEILERTD